MNCLRSILMLLFFCAGALRAAEVTATLSTDSVEAGQAARLTLSIEGGSVRGRPTFPEVKDLIINQRGQSRNMRIINGKMSRSVVYTYIVGSQKEGEYVIPSATVNVGGEELKTEPLKLTVRPGAGAAPAGMGDDDQADDAEESSGDYGYLTFQLSKRERTNVYPGEIAPVRIRAYFPMDASVSLSGPPRPEGSAFTLHNLTEEPQQTTEVVNGKRYRVVTWFGGLSATKAGEYPASFELEARVRVRDLTAPTRRRGSVFDDFFAPVVEKEVVLTTDSPPQIEVTELPLEGRPVDFTGAIGNFEFESVQLPAELEVGEPFRIEASLKGTGNFGLLKPPGLLPREDWKVYDGEDQFLPGDMASFAGSKRFRFNAVPLVPGDEPVVLGFSYFDPEKGEYRSVISEPSPVTITGELAKKPAPLAEAVEVSEPAMEGPQLAPLRKDLGRVASYEPWSSRSWFLPVVGGSIGLSLAMLGAGWWRGRQVDPSKAIRKANAKAIEEAVSRASSAASGGDEAGFFSAAREAIRIRVAEQRGMKADAVTSADLGDLEDDALIKLLKEADRLDYSGASGAAEDLKRWHEQLEHVLRRLGETEGRRAA